jgi:adenine-specific DNA-methyltransferase
VTDIEERNTKGLDYQKLRGGYYTPELISDFLADWVVRSSNDRILEPSCGDGALLKAVAGHLLERGASPDMAARQIYGVELDPKEAEKAQDTLVRLGFPEGKINVSAGDFFQHRRKLGGGDLFSGDLSTGQFDGVIGNPPFIRYQNFPEDSRTLAFDQMNRAGLNPNGHTNMWVPFLILSSTLLGDEGRLGMVTPAELFQVKYAAETRKFLARFFDQLTLITFRKLVFEGIQQEVILLLGERGDVEHEGIRLIEMDRADDLNGYRHDEISSVEVKPLNHSKEKWTQYYLETQEIKLLREVEEKEGITKSGEVYDVSVGVVTGKNDFFILEQDEVEEKGLSEETIDIVTRSGHLEGAVFHRTDWKDNNDIQRASKLFKPQDASLEDLSESARSYIKEGQEEEHHTGYKCRVRDRWYIVPSVWVPDAFMLRQVHSYPKLIVNDAEATCTDTIHRVKFHDDWEKKRREVTAAFINSLTFAFAEVRGRSYGGGVLTFEPSEGEDLPLPLGEADKLNLTEIDRLVREDRIEEALDMNDRILLEEGLGLSRRKIQALRGIWKKLRDRRIERK